MKITLFIIFLAFSKKQIQANTTILSKNIQTKSNDTIEDKVRKRGVFELPNDKVDSTYYHDDDDDDDNFLGLPITDMPLQPTPPIIFATFPTELIITTTPVPVVEPTPSADLINLGQTTHVEKTITVYKGVPQPYAVIKHVHVPVKVPVAVPVPVEKTVHVPVKVPVKVPVPQPYPVIKEVRVPVKVFVDKPYPVYLHHHYGHAHEGFHHYHYGHEHGHWGFLDGPKPIANSGSNLEDGHIDWSLKLPPTIGILEKVPLNSHHKLPDDLPQFITQSNENEKLMSASNKVEASLLKKTNSITSETTKQNFPSHQFRGNKVGHRNQDNYNYHYKLSKGNRNQREHRRRNTQDATQHKDELILHSSF